MRQELKKSTSHVDELGNRMHHEQNRRLDVHDTIHPFIIEEPVIKQSQFHTLLNLFTPTSQKPTNKHPPRKNIWLNDLIWRVVCTAYKPHNIDYNKLFITLIQNLLAYQSCCLLWCPNFISVNKNLNWVSISGLILSREYQLEVLV